MQKTKQQKLCLNVARRNRHMIEKLEVGRWFDVTPPILKECTISGISNNRAHTVSEEIINSKKYYDNSVITCWSLLR